jgi:hypothetical protein
MSCATTALAEVEMRCATTALAEVETSCPTTVLAPLFLHPLSHPCACTLVRTHVIHAHAHKQVTTGMDRSVTRSKRSERDTAENHHTQAHKKQEPGGGGGGGIPPPIFGGCPIGGAGCPGGPCCICPGGPCCICPGGPCCIQGGGGPACPGGPITVM